MKAIALRFSQIATLAVASVTAASFVGCASSDHHSASAKSYPFDKCLVSGDAFDHGKPVVLVYQGQEVKLCCKDCQKDFAKDPEKFLKKLADAK